MLVKSKPKPTRIIVKPIGILGEEKTKLAESAQCIYLAIAQLEGQCSEGDIDLNLTKYKSYFNVDTTVKEIRKKLPPSWFLSATLLANHLVKKLKRKDYVFARSGADVAKIKEKFAKLNKLEPRESQFTNINKWNPADIWLFRKGFNIRLGDIKTLFSLNEYLRRAIEDGNIIPLSLKKASSNRPQITSHNTYEDLRRDRRPVDHVQYITDEITTGRGNWLTSKSANIRFTQDGKKGVFSVRSPQRGRLFNLEGKLTAGNSNLGKFSKEKAADILNAYKAKPLPNYNVSQLTKRSHNLDEGLIEEVYQLGKKLDPSKTDFTLDQFREFVNTKLEKDKDGDWLSSKYQAMTFIDSFRTIPKNNRNKVVQEIYAVARAQSDLSGPYLEIK